MLLQQESAQQSIALRKAAMAQARTVKGEGKGRCSKEAREDLEKGGGGGARAQEHPHHVRSHPALCLGRWQGAGRGNLAGWALCRVTSPAAAPRAGLARPGAAPSLPWGGSDKDKISRA